MARTMPLGERVGEREGDRLLCHHEETFGHQGSAREGGVLRRNTKWMTFASIYSMMYFPLGVGPAFAYTGWIPGLAMLTYAAASSYVSGILLGHLASEKGMDTYPKVAKKAFGGAGERFIATTQSALYFACGVYNIAFMPESFRQLTGGSRGDGDGYSDVTYMVVTWAIMSLGAQLPTYHDTFAICAISGIVSTLNAALQLVVAFVYQRGESHHHSHVLAGDFTSVASALPAIAYAFGGHGVFPEEVRELRMGNRNRNEFTQCVSMLYFFAVPWYYVCSIVTYHFYGDAIHGNVIANWPQGVWVTSVGAVFALVGALVIAVVSNQATLMGLEHACLGRAGEAGQQPQRVAVASKPGQVPMVPIAPSGGDTPALSPPPPPSSFPRVPHVLARVLVRLGFVTAQLVVALLLRRSPLQFIQGFMGAFGVGCLTFWAPFLIYVKINGRTMGLAARVMMYLACAIGLAISISGMAFSGTEIVRRAAAGWNSKQKM